MEAMERTVGAYEAKTKLPQLLEEVAKGKTITITKHGVAVAQLIPYPKKRPRDLKKVIEEFEEWQAKQNITLGGITIRELIEEGRP